MSDYRISEILVEAVKGFEGLRLTAYKDSAGVVTIGYGHTGEVMNGQRITESQAEEYLRHDLQMAGRQVNRLGVAKTQGQFDALTDFVFNLGIGQLRSSTLLRKIRAGAGSADIEREFRRWVYAGGRRLNGLVKRREWEVGRWRGLI